MSDPTARMKAKLQERVRATAGKAMANLRAGETLDLETGEIKPEPAPAPQPAAPALPAAKLEWCEPVVNKNGSGYQTAAGTEYVVRKTMTKDQIMYWAWYARKLLGYAPTQEAAREFCEARHRRESTCQ
jgi:hypothetical protein